AVVDGDPRPSHQVRVEPRLARPPAGAAVEGDPLLRRDAGLRPVRRDLRVGAHGVVDGAVVLHVVRVTPAVAPDVSGDPPGGRDVVVAAALADVLVPGADADEGGVLRVGEDLLRLGEIDDHLRARRDRGAEGRDRYGLARRRLERLAAADPRVVPAVQQADVVDARVREDQRRTGGRDLPGAAAGPLLVRMAFG